MPEGPSSDFYKIYLYVNILDDMGGTTVFPIVTPVTVYPFDDLAYNMVYSIVNESSVDQINAYINSGNLNILAKNVIPLSTALNIISKRVLTTSDNLLARARKYMIDRVTESSLSDLSSIKVISSSLSASTETHEQVSSTTGVSTN